MSTRPISRLGNPQLREPSVEIPAEKIGSTEVKNLVKLLFEHMAHYGGVGIAAAQIGINKKVFVYGFESNPRYPGQGPVAMTAMINPTIVEYSKQHIDMYEGCLSVRGLRGQVPRSEHITVEGFDEHGKAFSRKISGFEARVVQHEMDHLNGLVFVDRIKDLKTFGFSDELQKHLVVD